MYGIVAVMGESFFMGKESEMKHGVVIVSVRRGSYTYFMSDVPHLIKTTRNCWYSGTSLNSSGTSLNGHLC